MHVYKANSEQSTFDKYYFITNYEGWRMFVGKIFLYIEL